MTILSKDVLLEEIKKKNIRIDPFNKKNIGPASIDLTLDDKFRNYKKDASPYYIKESSKLERVTIPFKAKKVVLLSGEAILGITKEKVTLSNEFCGWLEGRSRFARVGLMIHTTAGFVQPGIANKQVLEISNVSPFPLILHAGTRICQIIIQRMEGTALYRGRFWNQDKP